MGLVAAQFGKLAAAAEGCDAVVATGLMPAVAGARSVAEKLGIRSGYVSYCPIFLPSPHHPPHRCLADHSHRTWPTTGC